MTYPLENLLPDVPDSRDHHLVTSTAAPESVDLSEYLIDIENQGSLGSCTAQAGTSALELLVKKYKPKKAEELDRLFLYYMVRKVGGLDVNIDSGAYTRDICKVLEQYGCPPASNAKGADDDTQYALGAYFKQWQREPSPTQFRKAKKYQIKEYARVSDIRGALASGFPVIIGMRIREKFMTCDWSDYRSSPIIGGHAMVVVGYNATHYKLANSWGEKWGDGGFCWMPIDLFEADCHDKWTIIGIKSWLNRVTKVFKKLIPSWLT